MTDKPEFCCIHSWEAAKKKAWANRDISKCKCDHNQYCGRCYPIEFRKGGMFEKYTGGQCHD